MTTKRLLEDVNILKKDRQKSESFETRKREREESGDDTAALHDGSVIKNLADNRRESTASTRLSYSSTSSSSSSQSPWTDLREDDVSLLDALESTMGLEGLASEVIEEGNTTFAREKNSPSDIQAYGTNQDDESLSKNRKIKIEKILLTHGDEITHTSQNLKSGNIPLSNESRTYHNEKEKSPLDTSFESELTPADTTNSRGSDSSSIQSRTTRSSSRSNT